MSRYLAAPLIAVGMLSVVFLPARGSTGDPGPICDWVEAFASAPRPDADLDPDADGCPAARACLNEAVDSRGASPEPPAPCEPIRDLLAGTPDRIPGMLERLVQQMEAAPPQREGDTRRLQRCARFLRCLQRGKETDPGAPDASRSTSWKEEFERICGHTPDAAALTTPQLRELLEDSENLIERLEKVEGTESKVYSRRLTMCGNLFRYLLEVRESP